VATSGHRSGSSGESGEGSRRGTPDDPEPPLADSLLLGFDNVLLTPHVVARALLQLTFSDRDKDRMSDLARKSSAGRLSTAERRELAGCVKVGDVLSLIHLKARKSRQP
jgi:hypothetical protein